MNYEVRFYVGAQQDKAGNPLALSTADVTSLVERIATARYGGGTVYNGNGFWANDAGRVATEQSVISEHVVKGKLAAVRADARLVATELRDLLSQDSVLVTIRPLSIADFV